MISNDSNERSMLSHLTHATKAIYNTYIQKEEIMSIFLFYAGERSLQQRQLEWKNGRSVSGK